MIADGGVLSAETFARPLAPREYLEQFGYAPPPIEDVSDQPPLTAEVHHGLWIVRCPCGRAGGLVWRRERLAWCHACAGSWRRVRMPARRRQIEQVLSLRPDPETRNWTPSESVADLERENAEHGVGEAA